MKKLLKVLPENYGAYTEILNKSIAERWLEYKELKNQHEFYKLMRQINDTDKDVIFKITAEDVHGNTLTSNGNNISLNWVELLEMISTEALDGFALEQMEEQLPDFIQEIKEEMQA